MKAFAIAFILFIGLQGCLLAQNITVTFGGTNGINNGNPIALLSFKIGAQQESIVALAGGPAGAARSQFTPLTLYKNVDQTTPQIFIACAMGKQIKNALLTVSSQGEADTVYFQIALENVYISTVNDDSTNSDGGPPFESFSLSYSKIGWNYMPQGGGTPLQSGFDIIKNVPVTFSSLLAPSSPSD